MHQRRKNDAHETAQKPDHQQLHPIRNIHFPLAFITSKGLHQRRLALRDHLTLGSIPPGKTTRLAAGLASLLRLCGVGGVCPGLLRSALPWSHLARLANAKAAQAFLNRNCSAHTSPESDLKAPNAFFSDPCSCLDQDILYCRIYLLPLEPQKSLRYSYASGSMPSDWLLADRRAAFLLSAAS